MVTSSIGGEGKSFISTNLAMSLAGSQKRVLLIDIDLRNPRISILLYAANVFGYRNIFVEKHQLRKWMRRTRTHNLFIIGTGKKRTKATEVLMDRVSNNFFKTLRERFDYIVVDTPPMTPVIDAPTYLSTL